ncbi:putative AMP-dependent synthetase/ligase, ANL domain-containing protein [Dioscorea sansibarensis]
MILSISPPNSHPILPLFKPFSSLTKNNTMHPLTLKDPNMNTLNLSQQQQQQEQEEYIFKSNSPTVLVPEHTTLPDFVLRDAEHFSDKVALVEVTTGMKLTYGEVARETRRFAKALKCLGLRKGHVVVVVLPNVAIYPVVALGIMAAGGVFSGANPLALAVEIRKQILDSSAKILVTNGLTYETKLSVYNDT